MATKARGTGGRAAAKPKPVKPGGRPTPPRPTPPPTVDPGGGGSGIGALNESEPPIIVSGGSVTITSKEFLSVSYDERSRRFVYRTDKVKVKKIKTRGKKDEEDESNDGDFTIKLYD